MAMALKRILSISIDFLTQNFNLYKFECSHCGDGVFAAVEPFQKNVSTFSSTEWDDPKTGYLT